MDQIQNQSELNILHVEDNDSDARLLSYFMKWAGFSGTLHRARNGVEAIDFLRRQGPFATAPPPDVVILDLNLPKLTGKEVLKLVKRDMVLNQVPILILTTSKSQEDTVRCLELGAASFFTKPINPDDIQAFVERLINIEFPRLLKKAL